jgi:flagellar motor switch protein FliG
MAKLKRSAAQNEEVNESPATPPFSPDLEASSKGSAKSALLELDSAQKAAAVVISLGADKASKVYQYMDPEDVERITVEVAQLGYLNSEQTESILDEYFQMCMTNKAITEGGIEYARSVLEKAFGPQAASNLLEKVTKSLKNRDFPFLNKTDPKTLFSSLQNERPQTISLILSYVDPDKAAAVVEQLDPRRQVKVVENMARMESASPEAIRLIESELAKQFSSLMVSGNVKVGGIDYVASMMNNLDRTSEKTIFDGLYVYDPGLVEDIRKRMFVFEDIVSMDDRSVQRFVRDCDPRDLVLSLKAANKDVANKLFSNMSSRMAQNIRDDLEITNNVRLKDVEEAQSRIVAIIRGLEESGEIIILQGGKDDIIA